MSSTTSELTPFGAMGRPYPVRLLSRSSVLCVLSSPNSLPAGSVARVRTDRGHFLGEVLSCQQFSQDFRIAVRPIYSVDAPPPDQLPAQRPESLLNDLMMLYSHLTPCGA